MTTRIFSEAFGEIDEKYIAEASEYAAAKKRRRWRWQAVAACIAVAALGFGAAAFLDDGLPEVPFVLTAYAMDENAEASSSVMEEGVSIPVSLFEAEGGLRGFVFSSEAEDPEAPASIAIASEGYYPADCVVEIAGLEREPGRNYYYYIPAAGKSSPYEVTLLDFDEQTGVVAEYRLLVEKTGDGFSATLKQLKTVPQHAS